MKVVLDTSPLCYLVLIEQTDILPALFDEVFIPHAVAKELKHPQSPPALLEWMGSPPDWLQIQTMKISASSKLRHLHLGERAAITLAQSVEADRLVIDEKAARRTASEMGLPGINQ